MVINGASRLTHQACSILFSLSGNPPFPQMNANQWDGAWREPAASQLGSLSSSVPPQA